MNWENGVMGRKSKYSPEVRERAVRLVMETKEKPECVNLNETVGC